MLGGPWVNPRHGRGPRYQVTAQAKRGTTTLHVNKAFKDQVEKIMNNTFGNVTQDVIKML